MQPMLSDQTLKYGEEIITALLGVDSLYRCESGDEEGLAVINLDGEGCYQPAPFGSYADASHRFEMLKKAASDLPEADRRRYYDQLCHSTLSFIRWRQGDLDLAGQLENFLHVPAEPAQDSQLDQLSDEMHTLLNQMGYSGSLEQQCAAWEARNRVPADEVAGVIGELMDEAWNRTEERLHIPAPRSDGMQIKTVSGMAYNARCNYPERTVELNIDPILTRQALKHLTVHECYPGHYVQFKLREAWYREGLAPADGLLSVVNSASSSTFEGIADNGMNVIDWVEDDNDRLNMLMNRYRAGIGTGAAWRMHSLKQPVDQVRDWLRKRSLVGGEGWVDNRMRFLSADSRAVLIWSYWWGEASVAPVWQRVPVERRTEFLQFLYGRMHSPQTVGMFQ